MILHGYRLVNSLNVERLALFKALADDTRYVLYRELAASTTARSIAELAELVGLHPNTVRPHLDRLRDAGLVRVEVDNRGSVGRPQHRYSVVADAPSLGLEPPAFPLMAGLLANVAAVCEPGADEVAAVGRQHGRHAATTRLPQDPPGAEAVRAEMDDLGFEPVEHAGAGEVTIAFASCPYRALAEAFPELVCQLHRGIVEGMAEHMDDVVITRFSTLVDRDPCQVELAIR